MSTQTFLGLPMDFFAQQPGQDGKVVFSQPKTDGLTPEAQDMIDMFSELDEAQCNELARLLSLGYGLDFVNKFRLHMQDWFYAKPIGD